MKILFLGGGNMAFSMISGLIEEKHEIFVIDPLSSARKKILKFLKLTKNADRKFWPTKIPLTFQNLELTQA